jgi:hypothetical protein
VADGFDFLLNVAGWIVAGLVTLVGVIIAQLLKERALQRQEDLVRIFEPVHKEVALLLEGAREKKQKGQLLWRPSEQFRDMISRGVLWQARHSDLRKDVDGLDRLGTRHAQEHAAFQKDRQESIAEVFRGFHLPEADREAIATDTELHESLATLDKARWVKRIQVLGPALFATSLGGDPEEPGFYEKTIQLVEDTRGPYDGATQAVIRHAEAVRSRLGTAIARGGRYQGGKTSGSPPGASARRP